MLGEEIKWCNYRTKWVIVQFALSICMYIICLILYYTDNYLYEPVEVRQLNSKEMWIQVELVAFPITFMYFFFAQYYFTLNQRQRKKTYEIARYRDQRREYQDKMLHAIR
jgi:uncharacterized BrkB/YihY/UPF0761 family membrane protein